MSLGFSSIYIYIYLYSFKVNHLNHLNHNNHNNHHNHHNLFHDFKIELLTIKFQDKIFIFITIKFISKRKCRREIQT